MLGVCLVLENYGSSFHWVCKLDVFSNFKMACSKLKGIVQVVSFVSEQAWNAFEDSTGNLSLEGNKQGSELQLETHNLSSTTDQYLGLRDLEVCTFTSNIFPSNFVHLLQ